MNIIQMTNIRKVYGNEKNQLTALDNVSLNIKKEDSIAIMGTSGSGKTTLLNIIGTIDRQTKGSYILQGKDVYTYSVRELAKIRNTVFGFVMQDFSLIPHYTTKQNIMLPLQYTDMSKKEKEEKTMHWIKTLKIETRANAYPSEMSGGQKQRVAIARALINDTEIILCDEPTGALDSKTSKEIMEILKGLQSLGKTLIIVTHDKDVAQYCNKKIFIEDGQIVG